VEGPKPQVSPLAPLWLVWLSPLWHEGSEQKVTPLWLFALWLAQVHGRSEQTPLAPLWLLGLSPLWHEGSEQAPLWLVSFAPFGL
jgi:hypothetical protein